MPVAVPTKEDQQSIQNSQLNIWVAAGEGDIDRVRYLIDNEGEYTSIVMLGKCCIGLLYVEIDVKVLVQRFHYGRAEIGKRASQSRQMLEITTSLSTPSALRIAIRRLLSCQE